MLDLYELKQLVAFAQWGTLSEAARREHISAPSMTRSMKHVEDRFGVPLFTRGKNHIELNENGRLAAQAAQKLLQEAELTIHQVQEADRRRRTIVVKSCAPAPLWKLLPLLSAAHPSMTIASSIGPNEEVLASWQEAGCDLAILPFVPEGAEKAAQVFLREKLSVCVRPDHELAQHRSLTFAEINGFNFLLRTELGFWDTLSRKKMPSSRFLVQSDDFTFEELVRSSSLPCFVTDYFNAKERYPERISIPLTDPEADVTFYLLDRSRKLHVAEK